MFLINDVFIFGLAAIIGLTGIFSIIALTVINDIKEYREDKKFIAMKKARKNTIKIWIN